MDILVANNQLVRAGGTETFTYTLIGELIKQKHTVEFFCFEKGEYSERLKRDFGIRFCSKKKYDLILANHNTTVEELYKKGLTIQTCHGIYHYLEQPSLKAHGYISISQEVQNHLLNMGLMSTIIYNGIDCKRFCPKNALSENKPKILSLCNSVEAHETVIKACNFTNLEYGILDKAKDNRWDVENVINEYDLVVGLGRSVYEAFACGRPAVIFDKRLYYETYGDGYFLDTITESLRNNCSGRALKIEFEAHNLAIELDKYNYQHGIIARNFAIHSFNMQKNVNKYLDYANTICKIWNRKTIKGRSKKIGNYIIEKSLNSLPKGVKVTIKYFGVKCGVPIPKLKKKMLANN